MFCCLSYYELYDCLLFIVIVISMLFKGIVSWSSVNMFDSNLMSKGEKKSCLSRGRKRRGELLINGGEKSEKKSGSVKRKRGVT